MTRALAQSYARAARGDLSQAAQLARNACARCSRTRFRRSCASCAGRFSWSALLFALSAGAGWWLVATYPELIGLVASEEMINGVEGGRLWTEGILNVVPSSVLSVGILANNIAVSIFAFCVGVFFGLGTFYIIATNGLMLGGHLRVHASARHGRRAAQVRASRTASSSCR